MANELYLAVETAITWTDTGGDEDLDLGALAADGVRVGSYHDFGVSPRTGFYQVEIFIDGFDTAPDVGRLVNTYISEGNTTSRFSGPESPADTTDGAGATVRLSNLLGPFPAKVTTITAADNIVVVYDFFSARRYLAPVVHNDTADALLSTADSHQVIITAYAWQLQ